MAPETGSPTRPPRNSSGSAGIDDLTLKYYRRAKYLRRCAPLPGRDAAGGDSVEDGDVLGASKGVAAVSAPCISRHSTELAPLANGRSDDRDRVTADKRCSSKDLKREFLGNAAEDVVLRRSPRFVEATRGLQRPATRASSGPRGKVADRPLKKVKVSGTVNVKRRVADPRCYFVGDPVADDEARACWPHHYVTEVKKHSCQSNACGDDEDQYVLGVKCHYYKASIVGCIFNLGDCAYIKGVDGQPNYIGRILEFFKTMDDECYFTAQWFFRAEDTVLKKQVANHDGRCLFYSDLKNDNFLDCLVSKLKILHVTPVDLKSKHIPKCDFYYDMKYSLDYTSFCTTADDGMDDLSSCCYEKTDIDGTKKKPFARNLHKNDECKKLEITLLDLYSGCGAMSTGLCLGARVAGLDLVTRWAVDINEAACKSLRLNHPETQVRNESGLDFFELLKEWNVLCEKYLPGDAAKSREFHLKASKQRNYERDSHVGKESSNGEFEVSKLVDICFGDPTNTGKRGLKFQVRWMGYGPSEDTWEPIEGLSNCQDRIRDFVRLGFKSKILPRPGDVDVICGGPPCQGMSGLNRHRNVDAPLEDEKNKQIIIFMDIVQFLGPKYVLMENVVDILKFSNGTLGRYALSRLVCMKYQARVGIMAAGCYGLPQFRLRTFFWGSDPYKMLPQFPLPTNDVVLKCGAPTEFERNIVAYDENQPRLLEKALVIGDALSDLPSVTMFETQDQMPYGKAPRTEFQSYVRASKSVIMCVEEKNSKRSQTSILYDHIPLKLNEETYSRICRIPKKKGACFRDLPGVVVLPDNSIQRDLRKKLECLSSGKPLVPDFCFTFEKGKSLRPFGRLWWDETVPTVLSTAFPHFQVILHPEQDRVLTVRENARLQGFPDFYRFTGTIKERYSQIGNAVPIPVGRALGYALGIAWQKKPCKDEPLMVLPPKFSLSHHRLK